MSGLGGPQGPCRSSLRGKSSLTLLPAAISSRSGSVCFAPRKRKSSFPLGFQARTVYAPAVVGVAQAILYHRNLPFVQLDVLSSRFGGSAAWLRSVALANLSRRFLTPRSGHSVTGSDRRPPCRHCMQSPRKHSARQTVSFRGAQAASYAAVSKANQVRTSL